MCARGYRCQGRVINALFIEHLERGSHRAKWKSNKSLASTGQLVGVSSQVRFPVGAHGQAAVQSLVRTRVGGNLSMLHSHIHVSLSFSFPLSLKSVRACPRVRVIIIIIMMIIIKDPLSSYCVPSTMRRASQSDSKILVD